MFGPDYLVAPVLEAGARSRSVYLPAGSWTDVDTGITYEGGQRIMVDAPLERIPVIRFNKEYMLPALRSAGEMFARHYEDWK